MQFRIADTFTDSLTNLTGQEQKAVKTTTFDLQMNPAHPGMKFHKIDRARDPNFWSVRVNQDLRLIVHKTGSSLMLCYVDHHDAAYHWAEQRKLERHPKTGAAQLVKIRETVKEIVRPTYVDAPQVKPLLFSHIADDQLLRYGVPEEWLPDVKQADEDSILELADHLPGEAAEALLDLAVGETPQESAILPAETESFDHPDAQRRFRVMTDIVELERALEFPWEKWAIFLHPAQKCWVEKDYSGAVRISGSAGTGKTVVALHRAVHLARQHSDARILLATFSNALANNLDTKLRSLIHHQPRLGEGIEVYAMESLGRRLYKLHFGKEHLVTATELGEIIHRSASKIDGHKFSQTFLINEWNQVVDAWQIQTWEAYRDVLRLGRKTRLPESQRKVLWSIFGPVLLELQQRQRITRAQLFNRLAEKFAASKKFPFDFAVIDESQDITIAQLRFLATLVNDRPDRLFFTGDLGQRIFQQPFSWKALGIDIRGRSHTLRINYRTSHQIRHQADRLLGPELADVDGNLEKRKGTISVFNGPPPVISVLQSVEKEIAAVAHWLSARLEDGMQLHEIGVFVRSQKELNRAVKAVREHQVPFQILDEKPQPENGTLCIGTMHTAKGLEFRAVAVMACDDQVIPSQDRIETVTDESDLEDVYNTERHMLYVACTRARDDLWVSGVEPGSEFLEDMMM